MIIPNARWRQFILILGVAVGVAGCSTIADLDPTGLLNDKSDQTSQFPADQTAPTTASDQTTGTTPDLASIPARPATSSATSQQQTAQALASDGAQARYSADALRGGTDSAAPPPAASDVAPSAAQRILGSGPSATASADAPPTADAGPAAQPQMAASLPPPTAEPAPAAAPSLPDGAQPAPPANAPVSNGSVSMAAVPPSANVQTASVAPAMTASPVGPSARPAGAEPAVPANAPVRGGMMMAQPALSDAALGFHPSAAPPLAPSVNEFVAAPIVAHYRQTASNAGMASVTAAPAVPAVPPRGEMASVDSSPAVVANMAAVSGAPAAIAAMNGGVAPTAVVYFPGDGTSLSTAARAQVRTAVASFRANGGQGTVRVVGHASSRTANMPVEKHLETIFDKSQARANAVAQELIHDGIPASRVLIDAVGDSQPVYYESMPEGEDGNRRAEIFVQG